MKNFKKIFALITVICMLASTMTVVFADTTSKTVTGEVKTSPTYTTSEGNTGTFTMKYRVIDGTTDVLLTAVNASPSDASIGMDVEIPSTIEDGTTTYTVIGMVGPVFNTGDKFSKIVMPDTITDILGANLFYSEMTKLKYVKLSNNINTSVTAYTIDGESVGYIQGFFNRCTALEEVSLPTGSNFTKIGAKMFRGAHVKKLYIPDNVTSVDSTAFDTFPGTQISAWVNEVYGTSSNAVVQSIANDIKAEDGTATKQYATNFDTYVFVDGTCAVTGIKDTTSLKGAVYMPEEINGKKVTAMMHNTENTNGGNIFKDSCDNLKEFYMADTITKYMVREKDSKGDYVIKDNYNTHYYNIFYGAKNLEKVHLSDNLTGIIRGIFANNPGNQYSKITEIVIPDGVTEISRCFRTMSGLKRVITSPDSKLTAITNESFDGSPLLEEVYLPGATITGYFYAGTFGNDTNLSKKLAIITTKANAASTAKLGAFAATKGIKVYTNVDANIIADATGDSTGVTVTLRSRGLGLNAMEDGCKLVYAIYNSNRTLAKIVIKDQNDLDFTESLIKTVENADITVGDGETVKVYAWKGLNEIVPVAQPAK